MNPSNQYSPESDQGGNRFFMDSLVSIFSSPERNGEGSSGIQSPVRNQAEQINQNGINQQGELNSPPVNMPPPNMFLRAEPIVFPPEIYNATGTYPLHSLPFLDFSAPIHIPICPPRPLELPAQKQYAPIYNPYGKQSCCEAECCQSNKGCCNHWACSGWTAPRAEPSRPMMEQARPLQEEARSLPGWTRPLIERPRSMAENPRFYRDQPCPFQEGACALYRRARPLHERARPLNERPRPLPEQARPLEEQPRPLEDQARSLPEQVRPQQEQSRPLEEHNSQEQLNLIVLEPEARPDEEENAQPPHLNPEDPEFEASNFRCEDVDLMIQAMKPRRFGWPIGKKENTFLAINKPDIYPNIPFTIYYGFSKVRNMKPRNFFIKRVAISYEGIIILHLTSGLIVEITRDFGFRVTYPPARMYVASSSEERNIGMIHSKARMSQWDVDINMEESLSNNMHRHVQVKQDDQYITYSGAESTFILSKDRISKCAGHNLVGSIAEEFTSEMLNSEGRIGPENAEACKHMITTAKFIRSESGDQLIIHRIKIEMSRYGTFSLLKDNRNVMVEITPARNYCSLYSRQFFCRMSQNPITGLGNFNYKGSDGVLVVNKGKCLSLRGARFECTVDEFGHFLVK